MRAEQMLHADVVCKVHTSINYSRPAKVVMLLASAYHTVLLWTQDVLQNYFSLQTVSDSDWKTCSLTCTAHNCETFEIDADAVCTIYQHLEFTAYKTLLDNTLYIKDGALGVQNAFEGYFLFY